MLLIETSALIAIVFQEPGYADLLRAISQEEHVIVSAANLAEALVVLERRSGTETAHDLEVLINHFGMNVVPFDVQQAREAHRAFQLYGKGRHPAALNFGDCLSYAAAKVTGSSLLYVGDDFARTDINEAL